MREKKVKEGKGGMNAKLVKWCLAQVRCELGEIRSSDTTLLFPQKMLGCTAGAFFVQFPAFQVPDSSRM